jgi:DNA-binding NtrC family response regulator
MLGRKVLLIVDDEEDLRDILTDLLGADDREIVTAKNGEEALALLKASKIDAVLSDINMPLLNGLKLLQECRESGICTPFVMLSGFGDRYSTTEARRLGAVEFVDKPFHPKSLQPIISKILG